MYNTEGVINEIKDVVNISDTFRKQEIILTVGDAKKLKLDFFKNDIEILKMFKVGDKVKVAFTIESKEFNGKYYNNVNGVAIGHINTSKNKTTTLVAPEKTNYDDDDDLPF